MSLRLLALLYSISPIPFTAPLLSFPIFSTLLHSCMPSHSPLLSSISCSALPYSIHFIAPLCASPTYLHRPSPPYPISTLLFPPPSPLKRKPNPRHNRMISNPPLLCCKRLYHCINMQCITGLHSAKVSIAIAYIH